MDATPSLRHPLARLALALAAWVLCVAPAAAQERDLERERRELAQKIEAFLVEQREAQRQDADRAQRQAPDQEQESEEVRTVRRHLRVMRAAVEALVEAGQLDAAHAVELAMHARELALEGRRDEEAARIREAAPDRAHLAEYLARASRLHRDAGHPDRADMLADLSAVYAEQARRQQRAQGEAQETERPEGGAQEGLDSLQRRVRILRAALEAYREAGWERNTAALERGVRYGELALEGADEETLARAAGGVPGLGQLVELLQGAAGILRESEQPRAARACTALAEYYAARLRAQGGGGEAAAQEREQAAERERAADRERVRAQLADRERRIEILRLVRNAHAEAGDREATEQMERVLRLAELQLAGADAEAVSQAAQGLSQELIIDLVRRAQELSAARGEERRAALCERLVDFYQARERERAQAGAEPPADRAEAERAEQRAAAEAQRAAAEAQRAERRATAEAQRAERRAQAEAERARAEDRRRAAEERGRAEGEEALQRSREELLQELVAKIEALERELAEIKTLLRSMHW